MLLMVSILLILNLFQWNFRGVRATEDPHNQIYVGIWTPGPPWDWRLCCKQYKKQFLKKRKKINQCTLNTSAGFVLDCWTFCGDSELHTGQQQNIYYAQIMI